MIDREPTDREIQFVIKLYRVAELLPLDVALEVLMTTVALLIRGSGQSSHLWAQLAVQVDDARRRTDGAATHSSPARMQ
jgi:hypothetical protein